MGSNPKSSTDDNTRVEEATRRYDACMLQHGMPEAWVNWDGVTPVGEDAAPGDPGYFTMETYKAASAACDPVLLGDAPPQLTPEEIAHQQRVWKPVLHCLRMLGVPDDFVTAFERSLTASNWQESEAILEECLGPDVEARWEEFSTTVESCKKRFLG